MARFNENQFNVPQFNQVEDPGAANQAAKLSKPKRSFLLQALLNYFDDADRRVREPRFSLDAQLLNPLANSIEKLEMRLDREQAVTDVMNCPINVDNFGTYFKLQVPDTYEFTAGADGVLQPPAIRVFTAEKRWKSITAYDDMLPVPSKIEVGGDPIACNSLVVYSLDGNSLKQEDSIGKISFPNYLHLKIDNLGDADQVVEVVLEGKTFPTVVSLSGQASTSETITITEESPSKTRYAWSSIDRITVWNLPVGATLRVALAPAAFGLELDPKRPAIHSAFRDLLFGRYWRLRGNLIEEAIYFNRFEKFETIQNYQCSPEWQAFALEPNTYGIFGLAGDTLVYADRREVWPDNLKTTALYQEPLYNLNVYFDGSFDDNLRRVKIEPLGNARSGFCHRFRYTMETPGGSKFVISPEGKLIGFTAAAGWRTGSPKPVTVSVSEPGSYRFTLDSVSTEGDLFQDFAVYANLAVEPLWTSDLYSMLPAVEALVFDRYQKLWVWTGALMIPLKITYDNFVFDPGTRSVYLTNQYTQAEIS